MTRGPVLFLSILLAAGQAACGEGTLVFGVGPEANDSISVAGNINNIAPPNATRDIVVFVYTGLTDPGTFSSFTDAESVVVAAGSNEFTITGVSRGDLTIVFLLDDVNADGVIDPGDPYAILEDTSGTLRGVAGGNHVQVDLIDITFESDADGGTATADSIRITSGGGGGGGGAIVAYMYEPPVTRMTTPVT